MTSSLGSFRGRWRIGALNDCPESIGNIRKPGDKFILCCGLRDVGELWRLFCEIQEREVKAETLSNGGEGAEDGILCIDLLGDFLGPT
ncbi:MAG: hypothetical protein JRI51_12935 [Deltaproteobacteria bacterium]|nr:hypothetical protein [Deltaproteobacteria bacterium]